MEKFLWHPPSIFDQCDLTFKLISPGQNGRHFADDIFRCIFVNEKVCILMKISLKFVPKGPIYSNPAFI